MFKGLKHTVACEKCGETTICKDYSEMECIVNDRLSDCCNAKFKYIGLQQYNESILQDNIIIAQVDESNIKEKPNNIRDSYGFQMIDESVIKIEDIIDTDGKVTFGKMFDALKIAAAENSSDKVKLLKKTYPTEFDGGYKYLSKKIKKLVDSLLY